VKEEKEEKKDSIQKKLFAPRFFWNIPESSLPSLSFSFLPSSSFSQAVVLALC